MSLQNCKRQRLSERKVSLFTGFHPNVVKPFPVFALSAWTVLKKAIGEPNISQENFCILLKLMSLNSCCLRFYISALTSFLFSYNMTTIFTVTLYILYKKACISIPYIYIAILFEVF